MTSMKKIIYTFPEALRVCKQHTPEIKITIKKYQIDFQCISEILSNSFLDTML